MRRGRVAFGGVMDGFDGQVPVAFDEPTHRFLRWCVRTEGAHLDRDLFSGGARDFQGPGRHTGRGGAPIDAQPQAFFLIYRAFRLANDNPRNAGRGGKGKGSFAAIENVDVKMLVIEYVEFRESGLARRTGPSESGPFDSHTHACRRR